MKTTTNKTHLVVISTNGIEEEFLTFKTKEEAFDYALEETLDLAASMRRRGTKLHEGYVQAYTIDTDLWKMSRNHDEWDENHPDETYLEFCKTLLDSETLVHKSGRLLFDEDIIKYTAAAVKETGVYRNFDKKCNAFQNLWDSFDEETKVAIYDRVISFWDYAHEV